jgi:NAD(P)-dependent dehydrogenase (short-subunit alcohol dehydrogenase family)
VIPTGFLLAPLARNYFEKEASFKIYILSRRPMGRSGLPGDFKGLTVFFCSSASDKITGVRISVKGGMHRR